MIAASLRGSEPDADRVAALAPIVVLVIGALLQAGSIPHWCVGVVLVASLWRIGVVAGRLPVSSRARGVRIGFAIAALLSMLAVFASFRTLNGLAAGSALLSIMGALKLLETRTARDERVVIGVALFLLLAACLSNQTLLRTPLYLVHAWLACAALALVTLRTPGFGARAALGVAGRALLFATPIALVFFLFFPRVTGQFWALPTNATATTGLGEEMAPGTIDRLIENYEPAFRVRFLTAPPPAAERYWRGPVLTQFDGLTWRRAPGTAYREPPTALLGDPVRQQITLEPSNRRWWFALESVRASPRRDVFMTQDRQLVSADPINEAVSYEVDSHLRLQTLGELSPLARRVATRLPAERNPRTLAFARELREQYADDAAFADAMLDYFRRHGFEYSLEPPRTSIDSVDDFLFGSKLGFCGHFASAFATVMRAGGVPARIVTGYLGGEWNPIGGYLIVRHSDAHAWTEVWLAGRGWVRIDPTAVVEPGRLDRGLIDLLPDSVSAPTRFLHRSRWLSKWVLTWDGVNHWWRKRVLEFDLRQQLALLERLGLGDAGWRGLGILLAAGFAMWMLVIAFSLRHLVVRTKPDRLAQLWREFCTTAATLAPARAPAEAPLAFAIRLTVARPDLAALIRAVTEQYAAIRYGRPCADNLAAAARLRELEIAVRSFARSVAPR